MCKNNCNNKCKWDSDYFATLHVFFDPKPSDVICAHPASIWDGPVAYAMGLECPKNTVNPSSWSKWLSLVRWYNFMNFII